MVGRILILLLAASTFPSFPQSRYGGISVKVQDPSGASLRASGTATSHATQTSVPFITDAHGTTSLRDLPFGTYQISVQADGFAPNAATVELQSAIPVRVSVVLRLATVETALVIEDASTLIDSHQTGSVYYIGSEAIRERRLSSPGRSLLELVDTQPGWLVEAHGVLHPRGSEYDIQYVVDGMPVPNNRSPAFAPEIDVEDVQSIHVLTANYPAEYGRKLGGVVEVQPRRNQRPGLHGSLTGGAATFDTYLGYAAAQFASSPTTVSVSGDVTGTSRYLDPPVEQNFTNSGTTVGAALRIDHDLRNGDRVHVAFDRHHSRFQVPNEIVQQHTGQRQDRGAGEASGQISFQHVFSGSLLGNLRARVRDVDADLWSNALSIPIQPFQNRGFREVYVNGAVTGSSARHEWKAGADGVFADVRESFSFRITDAGAYEGVPAGFSFTDRQQAREQAAFVQDTIRFGKLTVNAGVRFDHYRLLVDDAALSPRIGVAWFIPPASLVLRASYDRVFQTPAVENLLLASSPQLERLNKNVLRLPVPASRGNFYQFGFLKNLRDRLRVEANWYRRSIKGFSDDDVLLNTGVSFPVAFARADVRGLEAKFEVPRWGRFSGFLSYANMNGTGQLPLIGGLFLGDEAGALLRSQRRFAITQDQRNTARGRVRVQVASRVWTAATASYGSGLPVELESLKEVEASAEVLQRVNFERGRVRPSFAMNLSSGAEVWKKELRSVTVQGDVSNLTNRLNVINFAGAFSGTAIAPRRSYGVRVRFEF